MCGLSTRSTCFLELLLMGMEEPGFDFTRGTLFFWEEPPPQKGPLSLSCSPGKGMGVEGFWHHHVPGSSAISRG